MAAALNGEGLFLDLGAATVRARSNDSHFVEHLRVVYGAFPFRAQPQWADVHAELRQPRNLRRWLRPQMQMYCDGQEPFEPFPSTHALPMFEWGCNWMLAHRMNNLLLLHAGAVERDGYALIMPATPGSGKSTLTAALAHSGWRLLSDEFGTLDPVARRFIPMLKPIALKNQSIAVIRDFCPQAVIGPDFPGTRKGTVAHVAPPPAAVAGCQVPARPGAIVLPRWRQGSATTLREVPDMLRFTSLSFNSFNYSVLGEAGYEAALNLARQVPAWSLEYSDLGDALKLLGELWPEVCARHRAAAQAADAEAAVHG